VAPTTILPNLKVVVVKRLETNLSIKRYSIRTLLSYVPDKPEFTRLREQLRLEKTVMRYDFRISNSLYKKRHLREHGSPPSPSEKMYPVRLRGRKLDQIYGRKHPYAGERLPFGGKDIRMYIKHTYNRDVGKVVGDLRSRTFFCPRGKELFLQDGEIKTRDSVPKTRQLRVAQKRLPMSHHKKYWYFLRKRGFWTKSVHHPYRDDGLYEAG
jgi:hypothetical protein